LEQLLSLAILLECGCGVVIPTTVGFDYQPGIAPEKIRLKSATINFKGSIDFWRREIGANAHPQEEPLQVAAGSLRLGMQFVEHQAKSRDPAPPPAVTHQTAQLHLIQQTKNLGFGNGFP